MPPHVRLVFALLLATAAGSVCRLAAQAPERLRIRHLTGGLYVYTTWNDYRGTRYPANGLYAVTAQGVVLVDSPWDTTQCQPLLDSIRQRHRQPVVMCLATHFHDDRTGGFAYFAARGIRTYATRRTDSLSRVHGMPRATHVLAGDTSFVLGGLRVDTYYPGAGHTRDNIVVWFPQAQVLYGGCLVKSTADRTLGNLADADTAAYAPTLKRLLRRYPQPRYVIPGHNAWDDPAAVAHTLRMARALRRP